MLTRDTLQAITVADWAPDTVFAFGGYHTQVSTTEGGVCALSTGTAGIHPTPGISTVALRWHAVTGVGDWMNSATVSTELVNPVIEDIEWAAFDGYTNGSGVLQGDVGW